MKYKMKTKRERNARIVAYAGLHPNTAQDDIARIFKVSQTVISRVLCRAKKIKTDEKLEAVKGE